jgi:phage terminase large subunit-like protein
MSLSLAQQFARPLLAGGSVRELAALAYDWKFWARPEQRAPEGHWRAWVILAGRGFGKTRSGAEAIREAVCEHGVMRIALVGATAADVRDVMVLGESGICNVFPPHQRPKYEPSKRRIVFHTGAIATLYSAEQPDRLRGPQHELAWCDELAAWTKLDATWADLMMGLRLGEHPRVIVTTTPRPLEILRGFIADAANDGSNVVVTRGRTFDNEDNLPGQFLSDIQRAYGGTRLGRQELEGEILEPVGGLFQKEWIERARIDADAKPECSKRVVALDPAITTRNDETGIVVVGRKGDRGYVLEDLSGTFTPEEWARKAVDAARRHKATIVAEVNRGGDLVMTTIRQFDRHVAIKEVRANRGKDTRAEPIAALYEQLRISHVGRFDKLEKQMVEWAPTSQEMMRLQRQATSPDRLDALVWGIAELGFHIGVAKGLAPLSVPLPTNRI